MNAVRPFIAEVGADLAFDVSKVPSPRYFDHPSHGVEAWKKVDFVFEWSSELWLVEVKDPENPTSDPQRAKDYIDDLKDHRLITRSLGPKGRESYLYLQLQDQLPAGKLIKYYVLFACSALGARELSTATNVLKRSLGLPGPHGSAWMRVNEYIYDYL